MSKTKPLYRRKAFRKANARFFTRFEQEVIRTANKRKNFIKRDGKKYMIQIKMYWRVK